MDSGANANKLTHRIKHSIGNAKEAGMAKDLGLTSSDYSLAVSIFFIGYLLLEVPSNMILSRTRPSLYLPALMVRSLPHGGSSPCVNNTRGDLDCLGCYGVRIPR